MQLDSADFTKQKIGEVYTGISGSLRKNNALDFDDLIMQTVELFQSVPGGLAELSGSSAIYHGG